MRRRLAEKDFPWRDIFEGKILDVGSGDDPLSIPLKGDDSIIAFDLPDGGGDELTKFFPPSSSDCIHGSQVLEHALDPTVMLRSWLKVLRPHGYIVATIPDWELYEKQVWPSQFNDGHRSTWSMTVKDSPAPIHCKMPEWLAQFPAEVLLCRLIDTSDHSLDPKIDQTFPVDGAEVFIEFLLKKAS